MPMIRPVCASACVLQLPLITQIFKLIVVYKPAETIPICSTTIPSEDAWKFAPSESILLSIKLSSLQITPRGPA